MVLSLLSWFSVFWDDFETWLGIFNWQRRFWTLRNDSRHLAFSSCVVIMTYTNFFFFHLLSSFSQTWPICVPTFTDQPLITEGMKVKTENANGNEMIILNCTGWCFWLWSAWDPGYKATLRWDTQQVSTFFSVAEKIQFTLKHAKWHFVLLLVLPKKT